MANVKISGLTSAAAAAAANEFEINEAGTSKKVTGAQIATYVGTTLDGDKGDITVSSSGATWTVDALAITTGKLAAGAATLAKLDTTGDVGKVLTAQGSGVAPTWETASSGGAGGATVTSSAVDITLTSSSNKVQNVSMTASGRYVILPNATTLTAGGPLFVIQNAGLYNFGIKDAAGNILVNAITGSITELFLTSIATSAGLWETSTLNLGLSISPPSFSTISLAGKNSYRAIALSSSLVVFAYATNSVVTLVAASVSGGVLTFGTPVAAHSATGVSIGGVTKLSSTAGALATNVGNNPNNSTSIRGFSVSGTTITVGTATTLASTTGNSHEFIQGICTLDNGTTGVVQYNDGATLGNYVNRLRAFTISGSTLTLGTAVTATGGSASYDYNKFITPLDSSTFVFNDANNTRLGSVSGTTITLGTGSSTLNFNSLSSGNFGGTAIVSATQFWNGGYLVTWTGTNTISSVTAVATAYSGQGSAALAMPKYGSNFFNINYPNDGTNVQTLGAQIADTSNMSSPILYYSPSTSKIVPFNFEYVDASTMIIFGYDSSPTQYLGAQLLTVL
jgi:hypothetical protein